MDELNRMLAGMLVVCVICIGAMFLYHKYHMSQMEHKLQGCLILNDKKGIDYD